MQVNPYLFYNGNCEAALKFYEKVLGARIEAMMTYAGSPAEEHAPPDWKNKILHAKISIDGEVIMASDGPGPYSKPQGFSVSLQVEDPVDAARRFTALSEGGAVTMPFAATFFSRGFGMCVDQFGIPWMVNCLSALRIDRGEFPAAQ